MKDLFLRICRWLLPFFGVSAVISCDNVINSPDMYGCPPAEYGTPTMEFRVSGKITDSWSGEPIKGISVTCDEDYSDPEVITSETGDFVYESMAFPQDKIKLKFTDIDHLEDGSYFPAELEIELKKAAEGAGTWDKGFYIAEDVKVSLDDDTVVAEYGTPVVEFSVKGRVVDAEANPIPNIEVSYHEWYEPIRTLDDGSFELNAELIGFEMETATLNFTDTDGEENGGEFETQSVDVPLTQVDPGDGHWDNGDYYASDVEIVLQKK